MHTERIDFWSQSGREQVGGPERAVLKHTLPHVKEPVGTCYMMQETHSDNTEVWGGEGGGKEV